MSKIYIMEITEEKMSAVINMAKTLNFTIEIPDIEGDIPKNLQVLIDFGKETLIFVPSKEDIN